MGWEGREKYSKGREVGGEGEGSGGKGRGKRGLGTSLSTPTNVCFKREKHSFGLYKNLIVSRTTYHMF